MSTNFDSAEDFAGATVLVCGTGIAGRTAIDVLLALGAQVLVCADSGEAVGLPAGIRFLGALKLLPEGIEVVVTSPGLPPSHPLLMASAAAGVLVLGELEFAWRIRRKPAASWLVVTGTNGKTTTVRMLEAILLAGGLRARSVGNVGVSVIEAARADPGYQVLAVEASSFQLHFSSSIVPVAGAILNLAEDHLDWHGSMSAYVGDKAKVWAGAHAIGNADDVGVVELMRSARSTDPFTFTLSEPAIGQYGIRAGMLVDAMGRDILPVSDIRPVGMHNVANALAAAALAGIVGVSSSDIAEGLRTFVPDPHRNELIATVAGIDYVDDSKATNPHAAASSLSSYRQIVWIAGGQLKGVEVEPLVAEFADRLTGAVLLGVDRENIRRALARHAPDLPVILVSRTDHGAMNDAVAAATSLAHAGDVILLAPAAASKDMYANYGERGLAFSAAVRELPAEAAR